MTTRTERRREFNAGHRAAILVSLAPDQVRARVRELANAGYAEQHIASEVGWSVAMVRAALEPVGVGGTR